MKLKIFTKLWEWRHPIEKSTNFPTYKHIAKKCSLTPNRVRQIAHGSKPSNTFERQAFSDLHRHRIISVVYDY